MATTSEYYSYLFSIRKEYSDYVVSAADDFKENGMQSMDQQRKIVQLNLFMACMDVFNAFDPTTTVHMFTADEMGEWVTKVNQLLNETYYVEFSQFYE